MIPPGFAADPALDAPSWAWSLLERERVARLATADASGTPHVVAVCFALADGALWTPIDGKPKTGLRLRRLRNLAENPRACLLVDHYEEDWRELCWVSVHGRGEAVDGHAAASSLDALRAKYPQYREVPLGPELIRLTPERLVVWAGRDRSEAPAQPAPGS